MRVDNRRYDTEEIRRRHPLEAEVRGAGIELRTEGRAFVGLCPFHADRKTPNFYVYPSSGRWWCYVCKRGGDVIEFVRRHDSISFVEACEKLEGELPGDTQPAPSEGQQRERIRWESLSPGQQMLMDTAAASYRAQLWRDRRAIGILHQRGLEDATIRDCGLGYCDGATFREFLLQNGWLMRLAFGLGLLRSHRLDGAEAEPFESMAGRLVIPEYRGGHAVWFIGRLVQDTPDITPAGGDTDASPKYLGLPGARPLLGYERVKEHPEVFLCEGPFDWLTAVQWGLPACSPCGTYLPADRLTFLGPSAIVFGVLDGDAAGREGGDRLGADLGERFRRLAMPNGMDLNDLGSASDGRQRFRQILKDKGHPQWAAALDSPRRPAWWRRFWPGAPGEENSKGGRANAA